MARSRRVWVYPELARFESDSERLEALAMVDNERCTRWTYPATNVAVLVAGIAVGVLAGRGISLLLPDVGNFGDRLLRFVMLSVGVVVPFVLLRYWYRTQTRRALRQILVAQGVAICERCGYDLTGNVSGRCPECGAPTWAVQEKQHDV